jgi:hypothetical protein
LKKNSIKSGLGIASGDYTGTGAALIEGGHEKETPEESTGAKAGEGTANAGIFGLRRHNGTSGSTLAQIESGSPD